MYYYPPIHIENDMIYHVKCGWTQCARWKSVHEIVYEMNMLRRQRHEATYQPLLDNGSDRKMKNLYNGQLIISIQKVIRHQPREQQQH